MIITIIVEYRGKNLVKQLKPHDVEVETSDYLSLFYSYSKKALSQITKDVECIEEHLDD